MFKPHRLIVFLISTIALANFFEAGRVIASEGTFLHVSMSLISGLIVLFTLFILGYWIYEDEKEKGNLKHTFGLYEWMYRLRGQKK